MTRELTRRAPHTEHEMRTLPGLHLTSTVCSCFVVMEDLCHSIFFLFYFVVKTFDWLFPGDFKIVFVEPYWLQLSLPLISQWAIHCIAWHGRFCNVIISTLEISYHSVELYMYSLINNNHLDQYKINDWNISRWLK